MKANSWFILQNRGLVKQQIDSYNYFINIGIKKIMEANKEIRSDVNHKFFVQYQNIYIGEPMVLEDSQIINNKVTLSDCGIISRLHQWNAENVP